YIDDSSADGTNAAVERYLDQHAEDYRVVSFDDSFSDNIEEVTQAFISLVNEEPHRFILVHNVNRCGALANLYRAIHSCRDEEIVVTLDGDDWLSGEVVLKRLNAAYSSGRVWLTHGTLKEYPFGNVSWCEPVPPHIVKKNAFREFKCPS